MKEESSQNTILIAEDSPPNRKILSHLLKKMGFEVIECEDGQKAWETHLQSGTENNLIAIISDVMMPNMDGLDLLTKVRESEKYNKIPFLLITAVSDKEYIFKAKSLTVNGYILKPITYERLVQKLKELFPQREFPKIAS